MCKLARARRHLRVRASAESTNRHGTGSRGVVGLMLSSVATEAAAALSVLSVPDSARRPQTYICTILWRDYFAIT